MSNIKVEMLSIDDFDHICRICSTEGELKPLFNNIETLSMLESFTQLQFSKSDELPDKICADCLRKINECFHFIKNCKIVDEGLRKCLNSNFKESKIKTDELHSTTDIQQDADTPEPEEPIKVELVDEQPQPENNENIKEIDVKQSEYYVLKWGTSSENQENKQFQFSVVNPLNEQDLIEQEAIRRLQAANRLRRYRARHHQTISDERHSTENTSNIPVFSQTNKITQIAQDESHRRDETHRRDEPHQRDEFQQRAPAMEETYRQRAKLTLPHEEHNHNTIMRRNYETSDRIALRRALAREQMRKFRNKFTAEETAEHRAQVCENMRKIRAQFHTEEMDTQRAQARDYIRRYHAESSDAIAPSRPLPKPQQMPLRLAEIARTYLKPREPLENYVPRDNSRETSLFSLRPTKIPQVKKQCYETRLHANENQPQTKFRSWMRHTESPDEITVRLTKNALQMKRLCSPMREPGQIEESALRRAKAAGQLQQYRPMLKKYKTVPHVQTKK